jgi:hypothetical protein
MRKFEFKKSYEEIDIAGEVFKVSLKDEDRNKYGGQLKKFYGIINKVNKADSTIEIDEAVALEEEFRTVILETVDVLFGEGSGAKLHKASDEQAEELIPVVFAVAEIINERRQEQVSKYSKKKKVK